MGIVRDFSVESIANIREIIRANVDEEEQWGICDWVSDWFIDDLDINDYLNSVSEYQAQMVDKYDMGSEKFDEILYRVHSVDNNYAQRFNSLYERIVEFQNKIIGISAMLSPAALSMNAEDYAELANNINDRYDIAIESYEKRISDCEESLPRLDDPSLGEKILNFAGGFAVSVIRDQLEGICSLPAILMVIGGSPEEANRYLNQVSNMFDDLDDLIVDNLVTDEESYYYGRVTGDLITMAAGVIGMGTGLMTIIGGITVTVGGTILSLTGVGAVAGAPAIAVSVPAVATGVLEMAGSAGIVYSGYNNMNDHIQKINEINSSPDKPDIDTLKSSASNIGEDFTGKLKGENVTLDGVKTQKVTYVKRPRNEFNKLRNTFNQTVKSEFLQELSKDAEGLKKMGFSDVDIAKMSDGYVPNGWQVHHKLPLDDSGNNDFDNLVLMKNDPYHKTITNYQNSISRSMQIGEVKNVDWPIPEGSIYPPIH